MAVEIHYESVDKITAEAPEGMTKFKIEKEDSNICILTLNKPESLNAFSMGYDDTHPRPGGWSLFDKYLRALTQEVKLDPEVKVVVITGAGRAFSSGADIKDWGKREVAKKEGALPKSPWTDSSLLIDEQTAMMHIWIKHLKKPVIAMVNGLAVGMGADLAVACDMRIASDKAFFQWAYILRGLSPMDGGLWLVPRLVGQAKAMEWLMTGDRVYADEALQWGLVNRVVPHDQLREKTMELAAKIAKGAVPAIQAVRFGIYAGSYLPFQESVGLSYLSGYPQLQSIAEGMIAAGVEGKK